MKNKFLNIKLNKSEGKVILYLFFIKIKVFCPFLYSKGANKKEIKQYIKIKNNRNTKKACYTCFTGNYDNLINHKYLNPDWDYICFTDNKEYIKKNQIGVWQIKPLEYNLLDNVKNARWHKMHPHIILKEYDESLWIDTNINVLTDKLFDEIKNKKSNIIIPAHFVRDCVFDECKTIIECGKDSIENMEKITELLKDNKMPHNWGLNETNIIYRKHKEENIINIMEQWWNFIEKYSKRDQASLSYVLWKNNIEIKKISISNARIDFDNFSIRIHKK